MVALPHALLGLALFGPSLLSGAVKAAEALSIEVFTTADLLISGKNDSRLQGATVTVHFVDGLERLEAVLSQDLPADADVAETEAFRRIGELKGHIRAATENFLKLLVRE